MANSGILFEMICVAIEQESEGRKVLVVNATDEFRKNGWVLATKQDYSPIVAASMIRHEFVVCNELPSLETVFGVLSNSAKQGVKKAIIIGKYDFDKNKQIRKHWDVEQCVFGKNVYILKKVGKAEHRRALEVNKEYRSLIQSIRAMENRREKW